MVSIAALFFFSPFRMRMRMRRAARLEFIDRMCLVIDRTGQGRAGQGRIG